jgi:hypothetical protein
MLKSMPAAHATPMVRSSVLASRRVSSRAACSLANKAGTICVVQAATSKPNVPPARERHRASVSICRTSVARVAPSASLIASSRCRASDHDRSRPPTFRQAAASSSVDAPPMTRPTSTACAAPAGSSGE